MQLSKCNVPHFPTVCKRKFRFCKKMREKLSHFPGKTRRPAKKHRHPLRDAVGSFRWLQLVSVGGAGGSSGGMGSSRWTYGQSLQRHMTLFQPPVGEVLYQRLQAGEDGDAQEHSQHPGQSRRHTVMATTRKLEMPVASPDLGADDVAVDLLRTMMNTMKIGALLGAHQQDQ